MIIEGEVSKKLVKVLTKTDPWKIVFTLLEWKWTIIAFSSLGLLLSLIYAFGKAPIYTATSLVRVEQTKKTSISNAYEILKSKRVLGEVTSNLKLDISSTPRKVPLLSNVYSTFFGSGINKKPKFWLFEDDFNRFSWTNETIELIEFDVKPENYNLAYILKIGKAHTFSLNEEFAEKNIHILSGNFEKLSRTEKPYIKLLVNNTNAFEGTEFLLRKKNKIEAINDLSSSLFIKRNNESEYLHLSIKDRSPQLAKKILNTLLTIIEKKYSQFQIIDTASVDRRQTNKNLNKPKILLFGFLFGAILAVLFKFFQRTFSKKYFINNVEELEKYTESPVFAYIPYIRSLTNTSWRKKSKKGYILKFNRTLKTRLDNLWIGLHKIVKKKNIVLFTSPLPNSGKSLISSSFAISASKFGKKVLLIDADIYRGVIADEFGIKNKLGLTDILATDIPIDKVINKIEIGGVEIDVITRGENNNNQNILLMKKNLQSILDNLSKTYDLVVIDTSPLLLTEGPRIIAQLSTLKVMVIPSTTQKSLLEGSLRKLSMLNIKVDGYIYNDLNYIWSSYNHYYTYGEYN